MTAKTGPLAGVRVLDLSTVTAGPFAAQILADQGADVIKVEEPGPGETGRRMGSSRNGMSAIFHMTNRGKRAIALDLKSPRGQEVIRALIARSDVLLHNIRPSAVERLGIGYEAAKAIKPDLVYCAISGFGEEGPFAGKPAFDHIIQCWSGVAAVQADPQTGEPSLVRNILADKLTGVTAAQAIASALYCKAATGQGQHIQVSMLDAMLSFLWLDSAADIALLDRDNVRVGLAPAQQSRLFKFKNGHGVAAPTSDGAFLGMCRAFGIAKGEDPRLATAVQRYMERDLLNEVMGEIAQVFLETDVDEAIARLQAADVPCAKVLSLADTPNLPHIQASGTFKITDHPVAGRIREANPAAKFSATPAVAGAPAPVLGQHTEEILAELGLE